MAKIKLPILRIGQKDENGIQHNEDSLKNLSIENSDCFYENGILFMEQEISDIGIELKELIGA